MTINITEWLDISATKYPDKTAIVDDSETVSYSEYRKRALAIARAIIESGVPRRSPILIHLPKSAKVLISFVAVAYSNNFYSPVDVEMPDARVEKILSVLEPALVIADAEGALRLRSLGFDGKILIYEETKAKKDDQDIVLPVRDRSIDKDILYVLFTSGSTGIPKGVCITHRSVVDYIDWVTENYEITENDSFANQAPFYFDNSILDIYTSMNTGAACFIIPKDLFTHPVKLLEYILYNGITTIFWVPSALIFVSRLKALDRIDLSSTIKRVLFCGEVMPCKCLNDWMNHLPHTLFSNLYGPTEITDACTFYTVDRRFNDEDSLPIGRPMRNTDIIVLDEYDKLISSTDVGVVGELYVRGTCLAVGYFSDPNKTSDAFIQNPLNSKYEDKLYRTGDLVHYNNFGELMYDGRKDHQVKIFGNRIELGEIEAAASSIDGVAFCCCIFDKDKQRLTLFIEGRFEQGQIRESLCKLLPSYMIPNRMIFLDSMPLTANGKIDRLALARML